MNNPEYITFDYIDNIIDYINNKIRKNNTFSKMKSSKLTLEFYGFRCKIMDEFCYSIVNQYQCLWIKKDVISAVLSVLEDLVMNNNGISDCIKDDICIHIHLQKNTLKDLCSK